MTEEDPYRPPGAVVDDPAPARPGGFLRGFLRFVLAVFTIFTVVFCVLGLLAILKEPGIRSVWNTATSALMAYCSARAFRAVGRNAMASAVRYAAGLLAAGFGISLIYRLVYVPDAPSFTDVTNFLLFGLPLALTVIHIRKGSP